ncbi:MAG: dihydropteroate synthase [Alphaproteobacteria bacterium]|nr:dihydropteroate synthase [Alphaproteobacteria bacterium]
MVSGAAALALCKSGDALALAGGPFAFTHACVHVLDDPLSSDQASPLAVPALLHWATGAARGGDNGPAELVERACAQRQDVANLTLSGAGARPRILGVCNVTSDSFSDGGAHVLPDDALLFARAMMAAGADIIDVGGESTRPGSEPVDPSTELARVLPVIECLVSSGIPVSIDTRRALVMQAAIAAGASLVNDVSALGDDPNSMAVVATANVPVILMHKRGQPRDMQDNPQYDDVVGEVYHLLAERIDACVAAGIAAERIMVDPGFGFGKSVAHNFELLAGLAQFHGLGCPVVVGLSRKSFIGTATGEEDPGQRVLGSVAAALLAIDRGVHIVRVHDVVETSQALDVWRASL